jgi:hypothetical protein
MNWVTVPDSSGPNQMFMLMNPANGSVFFRLTANLSMKYKLSIAGGTLEIEP